MHGVHHLALARSPLRNESEIPSAPEPPADFAYLWEWFQQLNLGRPAGAFGIALLSYQDLYFWSLLTQTSLRHDEVCVLLSVDRVYCHRLQELQSKPGNR